VRGELETKDNQLSGITSELERLREDRHSLKGEVEEMGNAITTLQTELEKVMGEVVEKEQAIAKLESELTAGENKQLPNPDPTKPVLGTSDRLTVGTPGLVDYINSIDPKSGIKAKTINNAITRHKGGEGEGGQGRSLGSLEAHYNFKYLGKVANSHKFSIPKL
jgi:hypothetical protein